MVWVQRAFGRFWGFQAGWWSWINSFVDVAVYPALFADYLAFWRPDMSAARALGAGAGLRLDPDRGQPGRRAHHRLDRGGAGGCVAGAGGRAHRDSGHAASRGAAGRVGALPVAQALERSKHRAEFREALEVENGELVNDGNGAYLTTDKDYGDIELLIDYKTVAQGRQRHLPPRHAAGADLGLHQGRRQVEPRRRQGLRRPLEQQRRQPRARTRSSWPTSRSASGTTSASSRSATGPRSTSTTSSSSITPIMENFWDRKRPAVRARARSSSRRTAARSAGGTSSSARSPPTRRTRSSRKHGAEGFESIFNGKDLAGWAGAVDELRGRGRRHRLQAGEGRQRSTRQGEYADFVARVEFQLPPGGNNGLAIRYPGQGRRRLRRHVRAPGPRRRRAASTRSSTRGSTTARPTAWSPAQRGYLRPVGEWNFEEVTVKGPTIKVELNGTRDPRRRPEQGHGVHGQHARTPARTAPPGYFGFAGHNDPVAFRNISIKELKPESNPRRRADLQFGQRGPCEAHRLDCRGPAVRGNRARRRTAEDRCDRHICRSSAAARSRTAGSSRPHAWHAQRRSNQRGALPDVVLGTHRESHGLRRRRSDARPGAPLRDPGRRTRRRPVEFASNSPSQPGAAFPQFTIGDMVNAEKRLVSDVLHLESLEAVIGISMGGMQAFDWAVRYPGFARRIIPIVGSPKLSPYDELLWRTELGIIERAMAVPCDQAARAQIMGVVGAVHELALSTPSHVNATLTRDGFDGWLAGKEASYAAGWDPYDWASQLRAMLAQDLTASDGGVMTAAAARVKAPLLAIVSTHDHMVNPASARVHEGRRRHARGALRRLRSPRQRLRGRDRHCGGASVPGSIGRHGLNAWRRGRGEADLARRRASTPSPGQSARPSEACRNRSDRPRRSRDGSRRAGR